MTSFGVESQYFLSKRVEKQGKSQEGLSDCETRETLAIVTNLVALSLRPAGREDEDD